MIERMLERELELHQAYVEIQAKLGDYPQAPRVFLDRVLTVAALWLSQVLQDVFEKRDAPSPVLGYVDLSSSGIVIEFLQMAV